MPIHLMELQVSAIHQQLLVQVLVQVPVPVQGPEGIWNQERRSVPRDASRVSRGRLSDLLLPERVVRGSQSVFLVVRALASVDSSAVSFEQD